MQAFAAAVQARFGAVDMLINNAGQGYVAHFHDTPREAWLHEAELKTVWRDQPGAGVSAFAEQSDIASITCVNSAGAPAEEHMIATSCSSRGAVEHDADALKKSWWVKAFA